MLEVPQILQLIIAIIGLTLNCIVGGAVSFGLKLESSDLMLIFLISLVDIYYYIHNIIRISLIGVGYLVTSDLINPNPKWWCPFDVTLYHVCYVTCVELVAILSFMRYLTICKNITIKPIIWYSTFGVFFLTNIALALIYAFNGDYEWSTNGLVCVPSVNNSTSYSFFLAYLRFWYSIYAVGSFSAYNVIAFSYFNVTSVCFKYTKMIHNIQSEGLNSSDIEPKENNYRLQKYKENLIIERNLQKTTIQKPRLKIVLYLMGVISCYFICILPDNILNAILIASPSTIPTISKEYKIVSTLLMSCYGIVSSGFVLLAHQPTRYYLFDFIKYLF